ncbi:hypothetical protein C2845_PM06G30050 [Panicum miliaceum]|uniref:Uncharacterized protein n=1 Tax=Panicum miliaceum TaxID=4540 RepID=A0A3L6RAV2_PANMI|nr:hypothetical protein C2845_PM06G30050 [Panicum miliaceum]
MSCTLWPSGSPSRPTLSAPAPASRTWRTAAGSSRPWTPPSLRAGSGRDVEELEINFVYSSPRNRYIDMASGGLYLFRHGHAAGITSAHVAAWLRFGERRVTRRFARRARAAAAREEDAGRGGAA